MYTSCSEKKYKIGEKSKSVITANRLEWADEQWAKYWSGLKVMECVIPLRLLWLLKHGAKNIIFYGKKNWSNFLFYVKYISISGNEKQVGDV